MTAARHRAAAIMLRSRYRLVSTGKATQDTTLNWGWVIWPALAVEHDRRAQKLETENQTRRKS